MKRDRDNTDFSAIALHYKDRDASCVFCQIEATRIILENELCYAIHDKYPVSPCHTLIIPRRHVSDFFELYQPEINGVYALPHKMKAKIKGIDHQVTGFNVGMKLDKMQDKRSCMPMFI